MVTRYIKALAAARARNETLEAFLGPVRFAELMKAMIPLGEPLVPSESDLESLDYP